MWDNFSVDQNTSQLFIIFCTGIFYCSNSLFFVAIFLKCHNFIDMRTVRCRLRRWTTWRACSQRRLNTKQASRRPTRVTARRRRGRRAASGGSAPPRRAATATCRTRTSRRRWWRDATRGSGAACRPSTPPSTGWGAPCPATPPPPGA